MTAAVFKRSIRDLQVWYSSCTVAVASSDLVRAKRKPVRSIDFNEDGAQSMGVEHGVDFRAVSDHDKRQVQWLLTIGRRGPAWSQCNPH